jgi:DNA-binding transcriptional MocR family regulator
VGRVTGLYSALDYVRDADTMDGLSPSARHLLTLLAVFTGRHGTSHPSVAQLAQLMGLTEANVRRARAELVAADRIAIRYGGGRGRANVYLLRQGTNPEALSTSRAPARGFSEETRAVARGFPEETRAETRAVPRDQEQGDVLTVTDAVPRGAPEPPQWIREGITYGEWVRRERAAGNVERHNPARRA